MTNGPIPLRMKAARRTVIYSAVLVVFATTIQAQETLDQNMVRFVSDVVCRNEFKLEGEWRCNRWIKSPSLSTFGSQSLHPNVIANVVKQLNESLPDNIQIQLLESNRDEATIKVYFLTLAEFPKIVKEHDLTYIDGNLGFFNVRWNQRFEIETAVILIAHDKLQGRRLHHITLEEITQSLGLAGDSKRFDNSIFYEDPSKNEFGTATRLSELDKKTIRFLYKHVEPGSYPIEVGILMARYWNGM